MFWSIYIFININKFNWKAFSFQKSNYKKHRTPFYKESQNITKLLFTSENAMDRGIKNKNHKIKGTKYWKLIIYRFIS